MKKIVTIIAATIVWWGTVIFIIGSATWCTSVKDITINELIKSSPVPVSFVNSLSTPDAGDAIGVFHELPPRIEVLNSLCNHVKLTTLLHEIAHAECFEENCKCMNTHDHISIEIHAYEYMLKWLLKNKRKEMLKTEMKTLKIDCRREDYYGVAASHITKTELWQKCLKYINK